MTKPSSLLDKRLNVYRDNLADIDLKGQVNAEKFVAGSRAKILSPTASVYKAPSKESERQTEALMGEEILIFENKEDWAWVQLQKDNYVGYIQSFAFEKTTQMNLSHRICVPATFIYKHPNIKEQKTGKLFLNNQLKVDEARGEFMKAELGGFIYAPHLEGLPMVPPDPAHFSEKFVNLAQAFLGVPYLWGGKSHDGLDCTGLVQLCMQAFGRTCPRDSDMMIDAFGIELKSRDNLKHLKKGNLVFWHGHVGIMKNNHDLIHANGYHMQTVCEPLDTAIERIEKLYGLPTHWAEL